MALDHETISIDDFNGLFSRGKTDSVPKDHFSDCLNIEFQESNFHTRGGSTLHATIPGVRRFFPYKRPGEASRLLILDNAGNLYDSLDLGTPILTIGAMSDFSFVPFFGRAYISPHNGDEGLPNEFIYVYDGTTCRRAGGTAPTGSIVAATSALSGHVELGVHLFAVAFETASGFITKPGPTIFTVYTAPGAFKVDLSNIPTGPSGTVARRILGTKIIPNYNGDQNSGELFFVPNGRIPDNLTTIATVDYFDADLTASADYLLNQYENLPACVHLSVYKSRLVACNSDGNNSLVYVSKSGEPESISAVDGFIVVDPTDAGGVKAATEFRDSLYIYKSLRDYSTIETAGLEPASWPLTPIDKGYGTETFGISRIQDSQGVNTDKYLISDASGLIVFNGVAQQPELSWKIQSLWSRINRNAASKIQVYNDPSTHSLFIALPLDENTYPNVILFGDYSKGLDPVNIRWSPWSFPWTGLSICVDIANGKSILRVGSLTNGNIYNLDESVLSDSGTAIDSYGETSLVRSGSQGSINHTAGCFIRVSGSGSLHVDVYNLDHTKSKSLKDILLSLTPGREYLRKVDFKSEKVSYRFRGHLFNESFKIEEVTILSKQTWATRPSSE